MWQKRLKAPDQSWTFHNQLLSHGGWMKLQIHVTKAALVSVFLFLRMTMCLLNILKPFFENPCSCLDNLGLESVQRDVVFSLFFFFF